MRWAGRAAGCRWCYSWWWSGRAGGQGAAPPGLPACSLVDHSADHTLPVLYRRRYYALLGERFCKLRREYADCFSEAFVKQYQLIHRYCGGTAAAETELMAACAFLARVLNLLRLPTARLTILPGPPLPPCPPTTLLPAGWRPTSCATPPSSLPICCPRTPSPGRCCRWVGGGCPTRAVPTPHPMHAPLVHTRHLTARTSTHATPTLLPPAYRLLLPRPPRR